MTRDREGDRQSPIEEYLDDLVVGLSTRRPRELRHLLAETEAHLRDDAEAAMSKGMSATEAEAAAVSRFGPVQDVVAAEVERSSTPLTAVLRQLTSSAVFLGAIGGLAVGLSGLVAGVIRLVAGTRTLVDTTPGQVLAPSDCARWLAADPGAGSCHAAALQDWGAEVVFYRIALGLVAVVVLLGYLRLTRRGAVRRRWNRLPGTVTNTVGATAFAIGGCWTLVLGLQAVVSAHGDGSGQWLSAAPVALAAAAAFGWRLVSDLRSHGSQPVGGW